MEVSIEPVSAPTEDVRTLLDELDRDLAGPYAPDQHHGLSLDQLFAPNIRFYLARLDRVPAGCGGVALFDGFAELKRLYVRAASRGYGVADALLRRIEAATREAGRSPLRLETGVHQHQAIKFYERLGFRRCGPFGDYARMPPQTIELSLFFEKYL